MKSCTLVWYLDSFNLPPCFGLLLMHEAAGEQLPFLPFMEKNKSNYSCARCFILFLLFYVWFIVPCVHFTHAVCVLLLYFFLFVAQNQRGDLIATVLGGKVIAAHSFPHRNQWNHWCAEWRVFNARWIPVVVVSVQQDLNCKLYSWLVITLSLWLRRWSPVYRGAEAAEELFEATEETGQRTQRAA